MPVSVVLLLREPHFFTKAELQIAGESAWGIPFDSSSNTSKHFVVSSGKVTLMKAGPHGMNFLNCSRPYLNDPEEDSKNWQETAQRNAWAQHLAWTAIDYVQGGKDFVAEYAVLARLAAEMIDSNCTGVYIPGEGIFISNNSGTRDRLIKIATASDPRIAP